MSPLFILSSSFPIGPIVSLAAETGTFEVHVIDSDLANLAGATVVLTDNVTSDTSTVTTNTVGIASFTSGLVYANAYTLNVTLGTTYSSYTGVISISDGETLEVKLTQQLTVTTSVSPSSPVGSGSITSEQTVGKGTSTFVEITANPGFVISSVTDAGTEISVASVSRRICHGSGRRRSVLHILLFR